MKSFIKKLLVFMPIAFIASYVFLSWRDEQIKRFG